MVEAIHAAEDRLQVRVCVRCVRLQSMHARADPLRDASLPSIINDNAQAGLEAAYVGLSDEGFPSLRRKLTRSKQRMSWDVHAHRLAKMISK